MSRRESRVSMNVRQNDALFEFESFKKKFLLANKHITKLNSTLSMKIEELNTEISTLYSENLRLRASEIALASQLKRERDKSRKILADAEAATQALSSHFGLLRQTFNIPVHAPPSPAATPPRKTTTPPRNSGYPNNPNVGRLAREPQVADINEDDEPEPEGSEAAPPRKTKKKGPRLSASRLPLPARASTPPIAPVITAPAPAPSIPPQVQREPQLHLDLASLPLAGNAKKQRRQSGLLLDLTPAAGAGVGLIDLDALELELDDGVDLLQQQQGEREREKEKAKERERRRRARDEKEKEKERDKVQLAPTKPPKLLTDVTNANSPRARTKSELALDTAPLETQQIQVQARSFLVAAPPSPPPPEPKPAPVPPQLQQHLLQPPPPPPAPVPVPKKEKEKREREKPSSSGSTSSSGSSSSLSSVPSATDAAPSSQLQSQSQEGEAEVGGRERRARKSVNYAEPKLNTKMRKPEPPAGTLPAVPTVAKRARSSAAAAVPVHTHLPAAGGGVRRASPPLPVYARTQTQGQVRTRPPAAEDDDEDDEDGDDAEVESGGGEDSDAWADGEYIPPAWTGAVGSGHVNVEGRRRHEGRRKGEVEGGVGVGGVGDWARDARRHSAAV
ncbi:hypothetical protein B0H16DRAFT_398867 [Mycena metata]|uniref:Shugoshin C-terminal domain-containing protein n=1 Tax=Mycena metata TaxID=1033252 RepID=A0AAD7JIQ6_9AGAR|nr:hypothetical protein B0H16DRAFT_398867 [Mycena metata]